MIFPRKLFLISIAYHLILAALFFINIDACFMLMIFWTVLDVTLIMIDEIDWEIWSLALYAIRLFFLGIAYNMGINIDWHVAVCYNIMLATWLVPTLSKILIQDKVKYGDWFEMFKHSPVRVHR